MIKKFLINIYNKIIDKYNNIKVSKQDINKPSNLIKQKSESSLIRSPLSETDTNVSISVLNNENNNKEELENINESGLIIKQENYTNKIVELFLSRIKYCMDNRVPGYYDIISTSVTNAYCRIGVFIEKDQENNSQTIDQDIKNIILFNDDIEVRDNKIIKYIDNHIKKVNILANDAISGLKYAITEILQENEFKIENQDGEYSNKIYLDIKAINKELINAMPDYERGYLGDIYLLGGELSKNVKDKIIKYRDRIIENSRKKIEDESFIIFSEERLDKINVNHNVGKLFDKIVEEKGKREAQLDHKIQGNNTQQKVDISCFNKFTHNINTINLKKWLICGSKNNLRSGRFSKPKSKINGITLGLILLFNSFTDILDSMGVMDLFDSLF